MQISPILAYIDPMSGAIVLQLLIAGIAGAVAFFRRGIWACIRTLTGGKRTSSDVTTTTEN